MASLGRLRPELRPWAERLLSVANTARINPVVTSAYRTHAQQAKLYAARASSRYPVAVPGTSAHEYGLAFDLNVTPDGTNLADLGAVWQSWGGVWGGTFGDPVHFEFPGFAAPQTAAAHSRSCGTGTSLISQAADLVLGFVPGIGEVELVATLVGLGFPRSKVLRWLSSPITGTICGVS
jgi:D-alanyl-D-alanine carboxypeptidase